MILSMKMMKKKKMIFIMIINYHNQPTGNSCGPACLKMAHSTILGLQNSILTIEQISELCGTDWIVGTPPDRMEIGINKLGFQYVIHSDETTPIKSLQDTINNKNIPILRTLTQGVPHWIVIESYIGEIYNILDPWLGRIQYSIQELFEIWSVRDYFYFEILNNRI